VIQPPKVGPTTGAISAAKPNNVIATPCFPAGRHPAARPGCLAETAARQSLDHAEQDQLTEIGRHLVQIAALFGLRRQPQGGADLVDGSQCLGD
jgi:hypothetical protein